MSANNQERRLRRELAKLGYTLCKSRSRNWSYDDQLGYMIVDGNNGAAIRGCRFDLALEDVQDFLSE